MDKYEKNQWCFAELVYFAETDKRAMQYCRWLVGCYGSPPSVDPQNQAEDFGAFARACGIKRKDISERPSESVIFCISGCRYGGFILW